jgi:hypothetical protein
MPDLPAIDFASQRNQGFFPTAFARERLRQAMDTARRARLVCFLCIVITTVGGCGKKSEPGLQVPPPAAPAAGVAWPAKRATDGGNFTVTIQPEAGGITRGSHFSLDVVVEPAAGAAVPDSVVVDADMPSHGHGMNTKPETAKVDGNRYRASGMLFHMAGDWSIMVEISAGATKERAFFPVSIE